jgi:selenocysteine-specific elongation factor
MHVIATAGHVDHGKSALVQALTGTDPDRLQEEKDRGLTIDLGFAHFTLPNGEEVSIVDVPGHERFVKNMLAGVGGIDLVLLVIAADEGVKPQTLEHLAILDLLDVRRGLIVLTKADLADSAQLEQTRVQASELIAGTTLQDAPTVSCSAITGSGLDNLVDVLAAELALTPARDDIGRPRLPVDRVFTMPGFGTIVTGTLVDGSLKVGQTLEACPGGLRARIRGLQHHGRSTQLAPPGSRTAVNLSGRAVEQLHRGVVLAPPDSLMPVTTVNARVTALGHLPHSLDHNKQVRFHAGSAEVGARLILLEATALDPGESGLAQLRFREPISVLPNDRFVIRDPNGTVGGGQIMEINPPRRVRRSALCALRDGSAASASHRFLAVLARLQPAVLSEVARSAGLADGEASRTARELADSAKIVLLDDTLAPSAVLVTTDGLQTLETTAKQALTAYHLESPLHRGMPREELRNRLGLAPKVFDRVMGRLVASGAVKESAARLALAEHEPILSPDLQAEAERYLRALLKTSYAPTGDARPPTEVLAYLEEHELIVRAGEVVFHKDAYDEMVAQVVARLKADGTITLATVRDMFGTSRKYAQALLEHLDARRVTRRVGDERILR